MMHNVHPCGTLTVYPFHTSHSICVWFLSHIRSVRFDAAFLHRLVGFPILLLSTIASSSSSSPSCPVYPSLSAMSDLNPVPASPRPIPNSSSRHPSTSQMGPPSPSLNILPSNQPAVEQARRFSNASLPSPRFTPSSLSSTSNQLLSQPPPASSDVSSASGIGPVRHPRPLTAAELHNQLEKEQEAVVRISLHVAFGYMAVLVTKLFVFSLSCRSIVFLENCISFEPLTTRR